MDKTVADPATAVAGIADGMTVMIGGFGGAGSPIELIHALIDRFRATGHPKDLTIINNNAGNGHVGLAALIEAEMVKKLICSFPRSADPVVFSDLYLAAKIDLELVPQGTLAERIRAAGAGIPAFYTPTAYGTALGEGKEVREFNGRMYLLEHAIRADVALVEAWQADRWGNLTYKLSGRNFNPIMATAAELTIVQAQHIVELGAVGPEQIHTPGVYVKRVVHVPYGDPAPALATTA
jgi:3-oxoadipate CoA-transferase alpha subunit